jgi:glycosyltransferase involved in cell wall biosynthesis
MKIGIVTSLDARDRRVWSGLPYYMSRALQKHCGDVVYIGPINSNVELFGKIINKVCKFLVKKKYDYKKSILLSKRYSKIIIKKMVGQEFDFLFAPASAAQVAFLDTQIPIVLAVDTTFALIKDYYPKYSNLLAYSIKEKNTIARLAITRSSLALYSSQWAADSAINDYHADRRKVHVIPFGANLDEEDIPPKETIMKKRKSNICRMLFLGVDWKRKGGEIAFEAFLELERLGISATMTVCGCVPPRGFSHERMRVIPFLDKNDRKERKELLKLFLESDFLILPTRSEAYGLVFCEGNAFGLPAITTRTGGVSGIVREGENGFMLPAEARGEQYAKLIANIFSNDHLYYQLVKRSRVEFDRRLNWDAWGKSVGRLVKTMVSKRPQVIVNKKSSTK